ncbi:hypothetical protein FACS189475_04460 [Betaproteobacteria bacterium]|nr:hypothetical protein FACS189475_04460 [Betaproteobacteria bacterium]
MQQLEQLGSFSPGSRIGILLSHGLGGTPSELKFVARSLNKYGFSVLCPLLAGHCASEAELVATGWRDWMASLEHAYHALSEKMDAVFVGGLSAGAVFSLRLALNGQTPPPRGLLLYSTTLRWNGWSIPKLRFLLPLVLRLPYIGKRYHFKETHPYGVMNDKLRKRIRAHMESGDSLAAGLASTPGFSLRELWRLVDIVKKDLPSVETPTLLIHAKRDDIAHRSNAMEVYTGLGGPAELLLLENSYHMITVDQERDKVSAASAVFCRGLLSREEKEELEAHASQEAPVDMPNATLRRPAAAATGPMLSAP